MLPATKEALKKVLALGIPRDKVHVRRVEGVVLVTLYLSLEDRINHAEALARDFHVAIWREKESNKPLTMLVTEPYKKTIAGVEIEYTTGITYFDEE